MRSSSPHPPPLPTPSPTPTYIVPACAQLPDSIAQLHLEQSVTRSYLAPHVEAIKAAKQEKFLAPGSIGNPYDWSP